MKSISFVLLLSLLCTSVRAFTQRVTLSFTHTPLYRVLKSVTAQSNYLVIYDYRLKEDPPPVTVQVNNVPLETALNECLKNTHLTYEIIEHNIIIREKTTPEQSPLQDSTIVPQVNGRITDKTGAPLIGATILVKGTGKGAVADQSGSFRLTNVKRDATLEARFTGYLTQEIALNARANFTIALTPDESKLQEFVVTGYGTQKKVNLTGAVAQVKGDVLQNRAITNVSEGLQGVIANLNVTTGTGGGQPGAGKSLNIRGFTGLGTSNGPLVLIDGVEGDINTIDPNEVESISVLKDAASAAIYGSRAPYGVILITTRTGKKNRTPRLTYRNNFSFSQPLNVPKMMNAWDFANFYNEASKNNGGTPVFDQATLDRIQAYMKDPANTPATVPNPNNPNQWAAWDKSNANEDWFKVFLKDWSSNQQHSVNIDGGGEKTSYFISAGYVKKSGLLKFVNDEFQRYNFRANFDADLTNWLSVGLKSSYYEDKRFTPSEVASVGNNWFHQIPRRWPTVPVKNPDGNYSEASQIPLLTKGGQQGFNENEYRMTGLFDLHPMKGLSVKGDFSYNQMRRNTLTTILQVPSQANVDGTIPAPSGVSSVSKGNANTTYRNYNLYAEYNTSIHNDHNIGVLVGYQNELKKYESLNGYNTNLYTPDLPSLSLTYGNQFTAGDYGYKWAVQGVFYRVNYNFREKYLLELNGRYNGTSLFLKDKRWIFNPSVSAGYNISKEAFWKPLAHVVNEMKLRASYGTSGDNKYFLDLERYYPVISNLRTVAPAGTNYIFGNERLPYVSAPTSLISPDLTWSKPSMLDLGVDAAFLGSRLQLTFDWYRRKVKDLFGPSELYPSTLGIAPPTRNNASIQTTGYDLSLSWQDKIGEVSYGAKFVFSDYQGKVLEYPNPGYNLNTWYNGQTMGEIWGLQTVGLFQSDEAAKKAPGQSFIDSQNWTAGDVQYADLNGDGKIDYGNQTLQNPGDRRIIGNSTPRFRYGLTLNAAWKGFDISAFFQGVGKADFFTVSNYFWGLTGSMWQATMFTTHNDRWSPDNPNGYFPKYYLEGPASKNQAVQTRYLLSSRYLRLKTLQIGYTFSKAMLNRMHLSQLRLYLSGENIFTIAPGLGKRFAIDPELLQSDLKIYPIQRTFSFGLNVTL
ncbi:MAG TPA: TonB-dependent receptor [Chitinophaga sp.]|uniref:TonB-dependent receptor n=1 Tax=Chitinophaga sp. TaxID=1869181 RepID=UPI002BC7E090|nr:TonB-dependent receptor [Chitinophaga sp.]HVI48543.1 TonB-dependent receptor [Chitinophaga sp.]